MNELVERFGSSLAVLGFPCNQFGSQEKGNGQEILDSLKANRPGNGFEPKFSLFQKGDVNGNNAQEIFNWLKLVLPSPNDQNPGDAEIMSDPKRILWKPVKRSDIAWNFEKFLIGKDGVPIKRYSKKFPTSEIAVDIQTALEA